MSNKQKRSVKIKQKKDSLKLVKEITQIVKNACINSGFLSTLVVKDNAEATYHNIMDYLESAERVINQFKEAKNSE